MPGGLPFPDDAFCRSYRPVAGSSGGSSLGGASASPGGAILGGGTARASAAAGAAQRQLYSPLTSGLQPHFDQQGSWGEVSAARLAPIEQ